MSKKDKLIIKLNNTKNSFTWSELTTLLRSLGFIQVEGDGSRVRFVRNTLQIRLHKPHPNKEIKSYVVNYVRDLLKSEQII